MLSPSRIMFLLTVAIVIVFATKLMRKSSTNAGTIIVVNGPSAVGKSSIIKAFQTNMETPWLSIGLDNFFVGVMPPKFLDNAPEHQTVMRGIIENDKDGNQIFTLELGPEGEKIRNGMHRAIAAYSQAGNNVIVDYINYNATWREDLKKTLHGLPVIYVGIKAPLEVIEERERRRATSPKGHARSHYFTVHEGFTYDLEIQAHISTPQEAAQKIMEFLKIHN